MKCLLKYQWVKLPRNQIPPGKDIMGAWTRMASRAAFRNGQANYCGYTNKVNAGGWAGGIVGLKSILGVKRRQQAMGLIDELSKLGYISYTLDAKTKKLTYQVADWVVRCSGEPCMGREAVYATEGYGFLSVCPEMPHRGLQSAIINLLRQTHGWISGATQFGRSRAMRFPTQRQLSSLGSTALF